jgi:rubrerythrin
MPVEEEEYEEELVKQRFLCAVCKELYRKPGMCPSCSEISKKRAA